MHTSSFVVGMYESAFFSCMLWMKHCSILRLKQTCFAASHMLFPWASVLWDVFHHILFINSVSIISYLLLLLIAIQLRIHIRVWVYCYRWLRLQTLGWPEWKHKLELWQPKLEHIGGWLQRYACQRSLNAFYSLVKSLIYVSGDVSDKMAHSGFCYWQFKFPILKCKIDFLCRYFIISWLCIICTDPLRP